ncbi:MAG: uracil-DNA glycosylase [Pseudomonadota bacterium]|nr:uracil-DNA glycosylase [Pseudomonadota bacterium]
MVALIPAAIEACLARADPSWHCALQEALAAVAQADPGYFPRLLQSDYLPTDNRLLAAFAQPLDSVRYVLVGEGPYPRAASATGVCFMDGAVDALWSSSGLAKSVNRATSLRNFIKMLLVAEGSLRPDQTSGTAMAHVGQAALASGSPRIQTLPQLQQNLIDQGFLLLNASLVFRPDTAPAKDALAWRPFFDTIVAVLSARENPPVMILWGKIAAALVSSGPSINLPRIVAEHPYNLSFIVNDAMHALFGPMQLLSARAEAIAARRCHGDTH